MDPVKEKQIPCINCITFPICNSIMKSKQGKESTIGITLAKKCSLVREYLNIREGGNITLGALYEAEEMFYLKKFYGV